MLTIQVPEVEAFDARTQRFVTSPAATLCLEHSLVSVSKWESKWKIPFLGRVEKTPEQILDYIKIMNSAEVTNPQVFDFLTQEQVTEISNYMSDNPTATTVPPSVDTKPNSEPVTADLIYYWMTKLNIPFSCETWHFQRLLTLIRVANLKETPPKKRSRAQIMAEHRALNEQRRKLYENG